MEKFYGYTFSEDGRYEAPIELNADDIDQIAHFICDDRVHNKMITDELDLAVVTTIGEFLDRVDRNKIDFKALQSKCIEIQLGNDKEPSSDDEIEENQDDFNEDIER